MSPAHRLLLIGLFALCQGCNLAVNFSRNAVFEVERSTHDALEKARDLRLAASAWNEVKRSNPKATYSSDFARGFKDGFAAYLYAGGTGDPPVLPPRHYWGVGFETPQGNLAIQDWFAGYRDGTAAAVESGYRQQIIIPLGWSGTPWLSQAPCPPADEAIPTPLPAPTRLPREKPQSAAEKPGPAHVSVAPLPNEERPASPYHSLTTPKRPNPTEPIPTGADPAMNAKAD